MFGPDNATTPNGRRVGRGDDEGDGCGQCTGREGPAHSLQFELNVLLGGADAEVLGKAQLDSSCPNQGVSQARGGRSADNKEPTPPRLIAIWQRFSSSGRCASEKVG